MTLMDAFLLGLLTNGNGGTGGGKSIFKVLIIYDGIDYTVNATFYEIMQAFLADKLVVFTYENDVSGMVCSGFAEFGLSAHTAHFYEGDTGFNVSIASNDTVSVTPYSSAKPTVVNVSGTTPTIQAVDNTRYICGELTSLTVSSYPASGAWMIEFESGSTATTTSFPNTIKGLDNFAAEANKVYEINVLDGKALKASW